MRGVGRDKAVTLKAAFELAILGETIDARTAVTLGLANRVVADADLMPSALAMAQYVKRQPH